MNGPKVVHRLLTVLVVSALAIGASVVIVRDAAQGVSSAPSCSASDLSLGVGRQVAPMTGERAVVFTLTNQKAACRIIGYPRVILRDVTGAVLPFKYAHSASPYITKSAPKSIVLPNREAVYFLVAKYRCDKGDAMVAKTISVYPPSNVGQSGPLALASTVVRRFTYCKGGPSDRGQLVGVSPVTATWASTLPATQYPNDTLSACTSIGDWPTRAVPADVVAAVTKYYAAKKLTPATIENGREWILNVKAQSLGTHWCLNPDGGKSGYVGSVPPQATAAVMVLVKHKPYPVTQSPTHFVTLAKVAGVWKVVGEGTGP